MRSIAALALMMAVAGTAAAGAQASNRAPVVGPGASHALASAPLPSVLQQASTYRLWPGRAPGAKSDAPSETPTITWYPPPSGWSNGTAVIVAPGGSYLGLAGVLE